ncbi:hypothetical protein [Alkalibacter saccharofermentans]|uniref:Pentatricopeptide repeat domain-containing protein (PPR motif) n=1 Tax=Alkalibacter saccharofermentans DSM 14828 TaxID=1120975 RepID=A0A1M5A7A5_9FIRM|nr:hypothetical protein [Alkalibacter saccharofermentans]SHF26159.1 pentatricopeptide repeat domain-containing protein (PPR motif) [Alkalibacter saccharofermentans DSM 14828]
MGNNMNKIIERFNKIKDHKPKATKKLNEIGDILASAYKIDPEAADQMWQYIVDLNVTDDKTNAKFYIAQVFNKLIDRMSSEDATTLIAMTPERVKLMVFFGYEGGTLWRCFNTLVRGFIKMGDIENAIVCTNIFFEKFGGVFSGNLEIMDIVRYAANICNELISEGEYEEEAKEYYDYLSQSENEDICNLLNLFKVVNGVSIPEDYEQLFQIALEYKCSVEYYNLLWVAKDSYSMDELKEKWVHYIDACDETDIRPYDYLSEDEDDYIQSKTHFYVELEKSSDELLECYFNRPNIHSVESAIIWDWIESEDWDRFVKYISMSVMSTSDESFNWSSVKRVLDDYMNSYFYDEWRDSTDRFGRSYKEMIKSRGKEFCNALARISAITTGCDCHESLLEWIKDFIQKQSGSLEILNEYGFEESVEERSAEMRLVDYIQDFLKSGKEIHTSHSTKYSLIWDALREEWYNNTNHNNTITINISINADKTVTSATGSSAKEENVDEELEQLYRLGLLDSVAEFYFKHCPNEYDMRKRMISACVKKGNVNRAVEMIDLMASTKNNSGYNDRNGWGRQNMLTIMYLIHEYDYTATDSWDAQGITDEIRQVVKQLVYRMMPSLPDHSREELKKDIYRIDQDRDDSDEYICQLLTDAEVYSTFPKPRGNGNAHEVNRMSDEFIHCFERLSKMKRLDIVGQIMSKFAAVKEVLKPVTYESWMSFMASGLTSEDLVAVYKNNPEIFDAWLDMNNIRTYDIFNIAERLGSSCTRDEFLSFRNRVISHRGMVEGIDMAFKSNSDNTPTQLLFEGKHATIKLDYIEFWGYNPISGATFHLLTKKKSGKLSSVRFLTFKINDVDVNNISTYTEFDDEGPKVGYNLWQNDSEDTLRIYSDFFNENEMAQINKVELQIVLMDNNANTLETSKPIILKLDMYSGEYKVI